MMLNFDFWKGKRIFVTGHTGFKGSWLMVLLDHLGAELTGYALDPQPGCDIFGRLHLSSKVRDIRSDVCDPERLSLALIESQPDIVLHLAAQSIVRTSFAKPLETIATNVLGTANLLQGCRSVSSLKSLVIVTSDKCYKNVETCREFSENDPLGGHDLYSASKACAEIISEAFRFSFSGDNPSIGIATARAGNVIGGGDWAPDRIFPDAIRAFNEDNTLEVRNPNAVRPWQHVLEPLSGYLLLAERLYLDPQKFSSAWNFGPSSKDTVSVGDLCDLIVKFYGGKSRWQFHSDREAPPEAVTLRLSTEKAFRKLNWTPKWNLNAAVKRTVDWYKADKEGRDIATVTQRQIAQYLAKSNSSA